MFLIKAIVGEIVLIYGGLGDTPANSQIENQGELIDSDKLPVSHY